MKAYISTATDPHWHEEELQWSRILSTGEPRRGMALVFVQKMCTAFHEFEPPFRQDLLNPTGLALFRHQLTERIRMAKRVMEDNGLANFDGFTALCDLLRKTESAQSLGQLADLTEICHQLGHRLCAALERG